MDDLTLIDDIGMHSLISSKKNALTANEICSALKNTGAPPPAIVNDALSRMCERGVIEEVPREPRQKAVRFRLLTAGRERLYSLLPEAVLTGRARRSAARLLALQHTYGVEPALAANIAQRKDGLATYMLAKNLGLEFRASTTPADLARRVAAAELGIGDNTADTLWSALVDKGVKQCSMPYPVEASSAVPRERANFAEEVKHAAPRAMNGWLGPQKLFIHRAWEAWLNETGESLDLPEFKLHLVQASRLGTLSLARADFTLGLDPADLASAETRDGAEIFHFLSITQEARS